jgi:hypothetical protein
MIKKDSTNVVRYFMMRKVSDGTAFTGGVATTFDLQYTRELTASAAKIDGIVGTGGAATHVDNKVFELDATSSPGLYMVCFPDAAFATGADQVTLVLKYDATVFTEAQNIQLVDFDPFDAVRMGMTALPNAAAEAAGGLATSAGGATGIDDLATPTNITAGTITTVTNLTNAPTSGDLTATMKTSIQTELTTYDAATGAEVAALNNIAAEDVWAVDATTQQTLGTFGQAIGDPGTDATTIYQAVATDAAGDNVSVDVAAVKAETALIVEDTGTTIPGTITTLQSDTDDIQTRLPAALVNSRMDCTMDATGFEDAAVDKIWDETMAGHVTADTAGEVMNDLQDGGRLDLILDAAATTTELNKVPKSDGTTTWNATALGSINTEVDNALTSTTYGEPAKGAPGATISLKDKIGFLYKAWRNKATQTSTTYSLFNDDASTVDHDATVSDSAGTATRGEMTDGP